MLAQYFPRHQQTPPPYFGYNGSRFRSSIFNTARKVFLIVLQTNSKRASMGVGALSERQMPYQNKQTRAAAPHFATNLHVLNSPLQQE